MKKNKIMSELEQSGETDPDEEERASESAKVVFKKPKRKVGEPTQEERLVRVRTVDTQSHGGSGGGVKMAEYVVGSKAAAQLQRERKQRGPNSSAYSVRKIIKVIVKRMEKWLLVALLQTQFVLVTLKKSNNKINLDNSHMTCLSCVIRFIVIIK